MTAIPDPSADADQGDEELRRLAAGLVRLIDAACFLATASTRPNELALRIRDHLGVTPRSLPVVSQQVPGYQRRPGRDGALGRGDRASHGRGRRHPRGDQRRFQTFSELVGTTVGPQLGIGPVDYADVPDSPDTTRSCVLFGLSLLGDGGGRTAVLLRREDRGPSPQAVLEVMAPDREAAQGVLAELRRLAVAHSVLRGQILSLGHGEGPEYGGLRFARR